jgi:hypothetical protein
MKRSSESMSMSALCLRTRPPAACSAMVSLATATDPVMAAARRVSMS